MYLLRAFCRRITLQGYYDTLRGLKPILRAFICPLTRFGMWFLYIYPHWGAHTTREHGGNRSRILDGWNLCRRSQSISVRY